MCYGVPLHEDFDPQPVANLHNMPAFLGLILLVFLVFIIPESGPDF